VKQEKKKGKSTPPNARKEGEERRKERLYALKNQGNLVKLLYQNPRKSNPLMHPIGGRKKKKKGFYSLVGEAQDKFHEKTFHVESGKKGVRGFRNRIGGRRGNTRVFAL